MVNISVVLVSFNTADETHRCIASLFEMDLQGVELSVVVVDNASKKPFVLTQSEKTHAVHLIRNHENLGFTGGFNTGLTFALTTNAAYIMALNNDTTVDRHLLQEFLQVCEKDSKIGIAVPKIYFSKGHEFHKERYKESEEGKVFWYAGGSFDWANVMSQHRGVDEVDHGQYDTSQDIDFATGCCMFFRRSVLENVGMFDDRYFLYYEDADLSCRVVKSGYRIRYVPHAVVWHENASSSGGSGNQLQDYYITRNRMYFGFTYAPLRSKFALLRESLRLLWSGRTWQKRAVVDFYKGLRGKGSYPI